MFLTIAGFEGRERAGLLLDRQVWQEFGKDSHCVITALTVQDDQHVRLMEPIPSAQVKSQLESMPGDSSLEGVKIGMLGSAGNLRVVADWVAAVRPPLVVWDPVIEASSGGSLMEGDPDWSDLLAVVDVVTPNVMEAASLTGFNETSPDTLLQCAEMILENVPAVVITGGHLTGADRYDLVCERDAAPQRIPFEAIAGMETMRGTGCRFSSALAALLASGNSLQEAAEKAGRYVRDSFLS